MLLFLCGFSLTVVVAGILGHVANRLNLALLCALWFVNGFCYGGGVMTYSISLPKEAPRDALGVLSTTGRSLQLGASVTGPVIGSWVAQHLGISVTFVGAGLLGLGIALLAASQRTRAPAESTY
ncbi:hypothetical protein DIE07_18025 [Burkholderia sp. Bp9002]|nr:hypothetical protein DIE07_18025 [Burkholderia sp. Bp9002]